MTTTKEPAATGDLDFANECGVAEEGREVVLIGLSFPLSAPPRTDIANEKSPGSNTAELIFAPAAAAIEIIKETGPDAFANAGYNHDEPRLPAGQPSGGQWTSGDAAAADRKAKRMKEAKRFALLGVEHRRIAEEQRQEAMENFGYSEDEYNRHQAAAESARDLAEEMERRANILEHGKEDDYRPLMLKEYGTNNPELNKIAAYYAEKFNDQATLNWLKLQHPYIHSQKDDLNAIDSIAMMLMGGLVTDLDGAPQEGAGSVTEKTAFDQASDAEESAGGDEKTGGEKTGQPDSQIPRIGGRRPINSKYAGKTHPAGVEFTPQGFPNFGPNSVAEVKVEGLTGNKRIDERLANEAVGLQKTPKGYVWHHVEDGKTMQLVPIDIHDDVKHTGGAAVIRNGGFDK